MAESDLRKPQEMSSLALGFESKEEEQRLKYLEFVQVAAVHAALCFLNVYAYAKERSGPLKPGVETVEGTVKTVVGPVYDKFHDVPIEVLKFVDRKFDESMIKIDSRVPPVVKQVSAQAMSAAQQASVAAQAMAHEVKRIASYCTEKYNEKVRNTADGEGGTEKSGGNRSAGKKKKKKGQNGKNADREVAHSGEAPASTVSGSEEQKNHGQCPKPNAADGSRPRQQAGQHPAPPHSNDVPAGLRSQHEGQGQGPTLVSPNHAAPRHHENWYQPPHHAPPAYMFGYHTDPALSYHMANPTHPVSYHTENPSTSCAASHYDPNPPLYSQDCLHPGMVEERPSYYMSAYHSQPLESFVMFSDENPNACSIM